MLRLNRDPTVRRDRAINGKMPWHKFTVEGQPLPKERARSGDSDIFYTPARTKEYEAFVAWSYKASGGPFHEGLVGLWVAFYRKDNRTVDTSNLLKALEDGLNSVAYRDDKQIVYVDMWRLIDKNNPRTEVKIWSISQEQWEEACAYDF